MEFIETHERCHICEPYARCNLLDCPLGDILAGIDWDFGYDPVDLGVGRRLK